MEKDVNEIIPGVWLGNYKAAYSQRFIKNYNIGCVLTIMDEFDNRYKLPNVIYFTIPITDKMICTVNTNTMMNMFDRTNEIIKEALLNNKNILIHCRRGHHRSASVVCAFLIKYINVEYMDALQYINMLRPKALMKDKCITRELFKYTLYLNNINSNKIKCIMGNFCYYVCGD